MNYEFGGNIYRNRWAMLKQVAEEYLTAGGENSRQFIGELTETNEELAADCISCWGLDQSIDSDIPSHMERYEYDANDLAHAIDEVRQEVMDKVAEEGE